MSITELRASALLLALGGLIAFGFHRPVSGCTALILALVALKVASEKRWEQRRWEIRHWQELGWRYYQDQQDDKEGR